MRVLPLLLSLPLLSLLACDPPQSGAWRDFPTETWENDRQGCSGERLKLRAALEERQEDLIGRTENEVLDLLGQPDQVNIVDRNKKRHVFFLEPGPLCGDATTIAKAVVVDYNAIGQCSLVSVQVY